MSHSRSSRSAQRALLRDIRAQITGQTRAEAVQAIERHLDALLSPFGTIAVYWPHETEPDLRVWMTRQHALGCQIALPVVTGRGQPLRFHQWTPDAPMMQGDYGILVPANTVQLDPQAIVVPALGFNEAGFRLGYGAGFYDRTLPGLQPAPMTVGVALEACKMQDFEPEPHDVPLDCVVTERSVYNRRK